MAACGGMDPVLPKTVELAKGLLRQRNLLQLACLELLHALQVNLLKLLLYLVYLVLE